ncbi:hypothetical protein [Puia dinghuensis]|uniref:Uncharacterized protein n=1 Tax=Puia dinghuensis TaxID=1792502 RepID=A0A8J2XWZ4_9BACT|nr:hypothetical protein [Puia dinghuensis]GGB23392.1 hypothetical protein GCM10011511_54070 [Puia dinghuensis]
MKRYLPFLMIMAVLASGSSCQERETPKSVQLNALLKDAYLPSDSYYISEEYYNQQPEKAVLLISEPHVDAFSQRKLLYFLDSLHHYDRNEAFNLYCVEGAEGRFDVKDQRKLYHDYPDKFDYALSQGYISGWEIELMKNTKIKTIGIEDPVIYRQQIAAFGDYYKDINRRLSQCYIKIINDNILNTRSLLSQIDDKAVTAIIHGAEVDIFQNSFSGQAEFKAKYDRFLGPLYTAQNRPYIETALSNIWKLNHVKRTFAEQSTGTRFYPIIKDAFPDSVSLLEDIKKYDSLTAIAELRDSVMVANTLKVMDHSAPTAVVFIGSMHKQGITNLFRKNKVSYIYYEHASNHTNFDLYLQRLLGGTSFLTGHATMPPSCLNPIIYPELKDEFIKYINTLPWDKANAAMLSEEINFLDKIKKADPKKTIYTQLTQGSSGESVYEVRYPDLGESAILKQYTDKDVAITEKENVQALNDAAREAGIPRLYPDYYLYEKLSENRHILLQEKIESITYKQFLEQKHLSAEVKKAFVDKYLDFTEKIDGIYQAALASNKKIILKDKVPSSLDIYTGIKRKLEDSRSLNALLYTEAGNTGMLDEYYTRLNKLFDGLLRQDLKIQRGVYIDYNMNNVFLNSRVIDPTDDCFSSVVKSKALKLKDAANYLLDFSDPLSEGRNESVINSLIDKIFPAGISEDNYKELIAQIYLYDFSDAKKILGNTGYLDILNSYNRKGVSDKEKYACMMQVPGFFFPDRAKKNRLLFELLKNFNKRFKKGMEEDIQKFSEFRRAGLDVFNNHPAGANNKTGDKTA